MASKKSRTTKQRPNLTQPISIRLSPDDRAKLDEVAGDLPALTVARVALRLGLEALRREPGLILQQPIERRGGSRR